MPAPSIWLWQFSGAFRSPTTTEWFIVTRPIAVRRASAQQHLGRLDSIWMTWSPKVKTFWSLRAWANRHIVRPATHIWALKLWCNGLGWLGFPGRWRTASNEPECRYWWAAARTRRHDHLCPGSIVISSSKTSSSLSKITPVFSGRGLVPSVFLCLVMGVDFGFDFDFEGCDMWLDSFGDQRGISFLSRSAFGLLVFSSLRLGLFLDFFFHDFLPPPNVFLILPQKSSILYLFRLLMMEVIE